MCAPRRKVSSGPSVPALWAAASLAALLGLGILAGCSGFSSDEKPLPDSTFARILTEIHLADARDAIETPAPPALRDSIFARYNVDSSAFDATLDYYSRHPKAFETLYGSVIDSLQSLQRPEGHRPPREEIRDSLREHEGRPSDSP